MASLGALLRELRLKHAASLDDLARTTKIGARQLEALEADDLARLPAQPFVKGFIRAYCEALGEPSDEALALYRAAVTAPGPDGRAGTAPAARPARRRAPVLVSFVLLAVLGVALLSLSLALRGGRGGAASRGAAGQPPLEPAAPAAVTATAAPTPAGGPAESPAPPLTTVAPPVASSPPAPAAPPSPSSALAPGAPAAAGVAALDVRAPYRLVARASAPTWVRVRMGGGQTIEETIPGGETREWISNSPFVLTIGNAGGLALELNGQALPPLGKPGMVVSRLVVPPESR